MDNLYFTQVAIERRQLFFVFLGVLLSIQVYFGVDNASAGLLQTVFIVSYMLVAPIFGYLGDRYNRKVLMLIGMLVWSGCTLLSSFISNKSVSLFFIGQMRVELDLPVLLWCSKLFWRSAKFLMVFGLTSDNSFKKRIPPILRHCNYLIAY